MPNEAPVADHRVPVIERMMDVLAQLERASGRPTIKEIALGCGVPRSTVYRILNTLTAHRMVVRTPGGGYELGSRLLSLAARVPSGSIWQTWAQVAQPLLDRLAAETADTAKLSVLDGDEALCVAKAQGQSPTALAGLLGARYPLHAGAASKILLAALPAAALEEILAQPLPGYTPRTVTDPQALRAELEDVRRTGWAEDRGEHSPSVCAIAAPVRDTAGAVAGAFSVAFITDRTPAEREAIRVAVCRLAAACRLPAAQSTARPR